MTDRREKHSRLSFLRGRRKGISMKEKPSQEKSLAKSRAPLGNDGKTEKYFT